MTREERFYSGSADAPEVTEPLWPGVSCVIFDAEHRILVMQRAGGGWWSLPGGRIDPGETAAECCARETLEETGLRVRVTRIVSLNSDPHSVVAYPDGRVHRSMVICFAGVVEGGDARAEGESEALAWVDREQAAGMRIIPDSLQNMADAWAAVTAAFIR